MDAFINYAIFITCHRYSYAMFMLQAGYHFIVFFYTFITHQQYMKQRTFELTQFTSNLTQAMSVLGENERQIITQLLGNTNERQKLKTIQKVLECPEELPQKKILSQIVPGTVVSQYIFGSLQSKSTVLNIFKVLSVPLFVLESLGGRINTFQHMRLTIEVIEMLLASGKIQAEGKQQIIKSQLVIKMRKFLLEQLEKATQNIVRNEFRTKWLQLFVQILRCVNYIIRLVGVGRKESPQVSRIYELAQKCVEYSYVASKQVITQLYLVLVFLNPELPLPESCLNQIHYLHACTIVKGQSTLKPLLRLAVELKDTEHKAQLAPILLKSLLDYFERGSKLKVQHQLDQQLKQNSFDSSISLFEVGRSIYSYLEQITDILIAKGANWSLEGQFTRKFFIVKVALKHVPTNTILGMWPSCLTDCFVESGNMTMPYVVDCAEALLTKLYHEIGDYEKWMNIWLHTYQKLLMSQDRSLIRGITEFINPILLKVNSSNSLLLKKIAAMPQENQSTQLGIISLIKCYKQIGKIQSKHNFSLEQKKPKKKAHEKQHSKMGNQANKQKLLQNAHVRQTVFIHLDDESFQFGSQFLLDLLISNDPSTAIQTLQFLIASRKPSNLILPQEMSIIIQFYRNCLKTSMPEFRKNYLNLTRRLLERFRKNYERDVICPETQWELDKKAPKAQKPTEYFEQFVSFLNELISICYMSIYPGSIFEITNPALEILLLILNLFGPKGCEIRKGTFMLPSRLLLDRTSFFTHTNFENLVSCLQSSYESIRSMAYEIIKHFSDFGQGASMGLRRMWQQAVQSTNKLSIRSYEFACRVIIFVSGLKPSNGPLIDSIPQKYSMKQLNLCYFILELLKSRYEVFKEQFVKEGQLYYKNLIHGLLTCFSYVLEDLSSVSQLTADNLAQLNDFLTIFFQEMTKILNFSVDISSESVSTVVLDTLSNMSQTDKKLAVDCRGHFLSDKKGPSTAQQISGFLDSSALISSMENQEEGIQNTLVVSFYLLTREAGLVFQSIGSLMRNPVLAKNIPKKELIELVNTYFYALVNLKHMGSVDRISCGLSKMAKVIFDQEDSDLMKIPEQLIDKLLMLLTDGKFTNILRRSAGVPFAFACLLKSEGPRKKIIIEKTIKALLGLSTGSQGQPLELRIHSLNILKKLFQDSDLKQDLDMFVSEAFISSINGFTSDEWGVRNSSLMLFSTLANRTVGIRPTFNLLQFFHKAPGLLDFISGYLRERQIPSMYPPLYPIVLLLSRLLPFDLRQKARITVKGETTKQVRKQQLLSLEPLLRRAGNSHNYMGRVMTAKAILPFMHVGSIIPHCLHILESHILDVGRQSFDNNTGHYRLTQCYQLLASHKDIFSNDSQPYLAQLSPSIKNKAYSILLQNAFLLGPTSSESSSPVSPTVQELLIRIYDHLVRSMFVSTQSQSSMNLLVSVLQNCKAMLTTMLGRKGRMSDLGHSLMYKSCLQLTHTCYSALLHYQFSGVGLIYLDLLAAGKVVQPNGENDQELACLVLEKIVNLIQLAWGKEKIEMLIKGLKEWLMMVDISILMSDSMVIQVINIYESKLIHLDEHRLKSLIATMLAIEKKSQNKHMKVAIFEFLLSRDAFSELQPLVASYSQPSQLEDLRQCCVLYLEGTSNLVPSLLPAYLRLLEDEQYEIRKKTATQISRLLSIKPCNELIVMRELMWRFLKGQSYISHLKKSSQTKQFAELILSHKEQAQFLRLLMIENSDFELKRKNHEQQRIFCYDKPNKYRSDISTLFQIVFLINREAIRIFVQLSGWKCPHQGILQLMEQYQNQIMQRNQYQFECLFRGLIDSSQIHTQVNRIKVISNLHPFFQEIYEKLCQKQEYKI